MSCRILALLSLFVVLGGCAREASAPVANESAPTAQQEAVSRIGDVSIRAHALPTAMLSPQVASQYGIARADNTVMLLVAVRQGADGEERALPATVTASATDLRGRRYDIPMRELRSEDPMSDSASGSKQVLLDYVGTVEVALPETLRFDLTVVRDNGATSTMQFSRDFYP